MRGQAGNRTLSEHDSKALLAGFGIPLAREALAATPEAAAAAAEQIGFPVALKLCGDAIAHKTERGLVRLGLGDAAAVGVAGAELLAKARPEDGAVALLVAELVAGKRELIAGLVRDPQFGPCVLLGLGGILTEALGDVAFAAAPLSRAEARALVGRLRASQLVTKPFRGEPAGDLDALADVLVALGRVGAERPDVASVDLNPILLRARDGQPVAVDALVELASEPVGKRGWKPTGAEVPDASARAASGASEVGKRGWKPTGAEVPDASARAASGASEVRKRGWKPTEAEIPDASARAASGASEVLAGASEVRKRDWKPIEAEIPDASARAASGASEVLARLRPLFHPRGVLVAGVSAHPGKFGFVAYHNLLRFGFEGPVFALNREGTEVLGQKTIRDVAELPEGAADLVFVCTPQGANAELLRACAKRGVRAAFIASGGYGEAGAEGRAHERELVALADSLGLVVAGPNGQGVISTPRSMCAQIVAPYPPPGRISIASQSGNLVSSFLNYAVLTGIGISKAISAGNSAQLGLADYLDYFAADPETAVALAYLEGVPDGRRFAEAARALASRKPLVLLKGGVAAEGKRAAASHTGSLASDDRIFDGVAAQVGALRAATVEQAFEWAATFATQPLPRGRRTVVFTTAGGWGVLAADACAAAGLELVPLPDDLRAAIDELVPPRWSRSNPIDLAGGETRDTIPEVLDRICAHPAVDAVIHLGLGIQASQAQAFRSGSFYPGFGLDRIVEFHERQDRRYAKAAREASERHSKPVLSATEQTYTDRFYGNAGPVGVREEGRLCYPSAHRAVAALRALVDYAEFRKETQ